MLAVIAIFSYSIAACAFLLLFALLLIKWRGRKHGTTLAIACVLTAAWAASIVYFTKRGMPVALPSSLLEIARNAGWSAFLLGLLNPSAERSVNTQQMSRQTATYAGIYVLLALATVLSYLNIGLMRSVAAMVSGDLGYIAMAVMGMLLIEQLFRTVSGKERWALKFACLGIGGLFAYDFYFHVDALLFHRVNVEIWTARGVVNAFAVPLIAVSAARNPSWSIGISVSRRVLFHSATLIGSALYLLLVAAAGYYLRFFGGEWGAVLQSTLLFGAGIFLIVVLFSGAFRSWLKVSISKHFYNYGYDYREEWLRFTRTLSVDGPELGERAIRAIADLVESPKGVLYTVEESGRYEVTAAWNLTQKPEPEPSDGAIAAFLKRTQWVIDIQEYDAHPEKYDGLSIPAWLRDFPQAGLVVPLMQNGDLFGFVVLAQPRSKIVLNWEVLDLLKVVGIQTASYLARQKSADALVVARQFETFNRMSTFVVHDLKNLVSQLALLVSNAERHKDSPEFQKDMLETIEHAVQKMRMLLQKFNRESSTERSTRVLLRELLQQAVAAKSASDPRPVLDVRTPDLAVAADEMRLERVIGHLIQNAIEATPRGGQVRVTLTGQNDIAVIEVADTGRGMSEQFIRERLFAPFDSTKSGGMGIGVFETREYVQHIGGRLDVDSSPASGTRFRITLPLYHHDEEKVSSAA
jgi:putative PEP-CTERM system histidine kinase